MPNWLFHGCHGSIEGLFLTETRARKWEVGTAPIPLFDLTVPCLMYSSDRETRYLIVHQAGTLPAIAVECTWKSRARATTSRNSSSRESVAVAPAPAQALLITGGSCSCSYALIALACSVDTKQAGVPKPGIARVLTASVAETLLFSLSTKCGWQLLFSVVLRAEG